VIDAAFEGTFIGVVMFLLLLNAVDGAPWCVGAEGDRRTGGADGPLTILLISAKLCLVSPGFVPNLRRKGDFCIEALAFDDPTGGVSEFVFWFP